MRLSICERWWELSAAQTRKLLFLNTSKTLPTTNHTALKPWRLWHLNLPNDSIFYTFNHRSPNPVWFRTQAVTGYPEGSSRRCGGPIGSNLPSDASAHCAVGQYESPSQVWTVRVNTAALAWHVQPGWLDYLIFICCNCFTLMLQICLARSDPWQRLHETGQERRRQKYLNSFDWCV